MLNCLRNQDEKPKEKVGKLMSSKVGKLMSSGSGVRHSNYMQ
jgi:hypothetical protein